MCVVLTCTRLTHTRVCVCVRVRVRVHVYVCVRACVHTCMRATFATNVGSVYRHSTARCDATHVHTRAMEGTGAPHGGWRGGRSRRTVDCLTPEEQVAQLTWVRRT